MNAFSIYFTFHKNRDQLLSSLQPFTLFKHKKIIWFVCFWVIVENGLTHYLTTAQQNEQSGMCA